MRPIKDIKEEIKFTEETLKKANLKAKDRESFEEALADLKDELKEASEKEPEEKEPTPTKGDLAKGSKFIEGEIEELEGLIADEDTDDDEKELYKKQLKDLQEKLAKLEAKTKEEKAPEHAPKKKATKPAAKKEVKKEVKEKEEAKPKDKEGEVLWTVAGKKYNLADCKQAIEAVHARTKQREKSAKQYKSKSPAEKAANNVKNAVNQIADGISDQKIENNPKEVIKALQTFHKKLTEGFKALEGVLKNKSYLTKLNQSLKAIDEVIAEIEKE